MCKQYEFTAACSCCCSCCCCSCLMWFPASAVIRRNRRDVISLHMHVVSRLSVVDERQFQAAAPAPAIHICTAWRRACVDAFDRLQHWAHSTLYGHSRNALPSLPAELVESSASSLGGCVIIRCFAYLQAT